MCTVCDSLPARVELGSFVGPEVCFLLRWCVVLLLLLALCWLVGWFVALLALLFLLCVVLVCDTVVSVCVSVCVTLTVCVCESLDSKLTRLSRGV